MNREINIEGRTLNMEGEAIFYAGARLMLQRLHERGLLSQDWTKTKKVKKDKMTSKLNSAMFDAEFLKKVLESREALELFMCDCDDEIRAKWYTDPQGCVAVKFTTPHEREEGMKAAIDFLFENIKEANE